MFALEAGSTIQLLPVPAPYGAVQLSLVGGDQILDTAGPFAMGAGLVWCDECSLEVTPEPFATAGVTYGRGVVDSHDGWIMFPCHEYVCEVCDHLESRNQTGWCDACDRCNDCCKECWHCSGCGERHNEEESQCSNCECCTDTCECFWCEHGEHMVSDHKYCCDDHCIDHCSCQPRWDVCGCGDQNCPENGGDAAYGAVPGWVRRGDALPTENGDHVSLLSDHLARLDPARDMATFYLCDYVAANMPGSELARDARRIQDAIVRDCDDAFRDYVFCALGGEVRHHRNVSSGMGRETQWSYWVAMGDTIGRVRLIEDACELFEDGSWSSGFGGSAWAKCARVLLARETGELDARTFVDRVFSLQHNGGSLLNKSEWRGGGRSYIDTQQMVTIGNAHASNPVDLGELVTHSAADARALLYAMPYQSVVNESERAWLENWHSWCDGPTQGTARYCVSPRQSDETASAGMWANRETIAQRAIAYAAAQHVGELVSSGAGFAQQYPDESVWAYNARLHALWASLMGD